MVGKYNEIFDKAGNVKSLLPVGTCPLKSVGIVPTVPPAFNWRTFDEKLDKNMQDYCKAAADSEFVKHVTAKAKQQNPTQRLEARRVISDAYIAVSQELMKPPSDLACAHPELQKLIQVEALIKQIEAFMQSSLKGEERKERHKWFYEQALRLTVPGLNIDYDDISGKMTYPLAAATLQRASEFVKELDSNRTIWQAQEKEKKAALEKTRAVLALKQSRLNEVYNIYVARTR